MTLRTFYLKMAVKFPDHAQDCSDHISTLTNMFSSFVLDIKLPTLMMSQYKQILNCDTWEEADDMAMKLVLHEAKLN